MENEAQTTLESERVLRRLEDTVRLFGNEIEAAILWIAVLAVVLLVGLVYVVLMYRRDSRTIGWRWSAALALLRIGVYGLLAFVFLLPAKQLWEKTETRSKVILAFDVSDSMKSRDDPPSASLSIEKLPTRQDKVIGFLSDAQKAFLSSLQDRNPLTLYRFGSRADEAFKRLEGKSVLAVDELDGWLKPIANVELPAGIEEGEQKSRLKDLELLQQLTSGTNLGGSALQILNREANNMLQGLVVFSDGRSTQGSAQALSELQARAARAKVPIFAVAVGEARDPISIRIVGMQSPKQARPDDKFPIRVEVEGRGLPEKSIPLFVDVVSPKGEKQTLQKDFVFKNPASGGPLHARAEFEIDASALGVSATDSGKPELPEGEWSFQARIPRDPGEAFLEKEHKSDKSIVQVVKRPVRVLLFAGAASKDYQFLRSLLVREVDQNRAELSIFLQLQRDGIVQDVPPERLLRRFPSRIGETSGRENAEDRYENLAEYDLIVAFDPEWSRLEPEQITALERWINQRAGGLVIVAGQVNTFQLARPTHRDKLKLILDLFPVVLQDSRLVGLGSERAATEPYRLNFPGANAEMEFLKLDDEGRDPLGSWDLFFTGRTKEEAPDAATQRGFYSYYPVEGVKPGATVVATYGDPRARLKDGQREQPYMVSMLYGKGRVFYIGSGEVWRLRQYKEVFFERFWTKLIRYAGSGNLTRLSKSGVIVMSHEFASGQQVLVEAQLFGRDMQPLSERSTPRIQITPPPGSPALKPLEMSPKPTLGGEWTGWFQARFRVQAAGEYRIDVQIPETGETIPDRFLVKESNPELDDVKPDFAQLYQLASRASEVLPRMAEAERADLLRSLRATATRLGQRVEEIDPKAGALDGKDEVRLIFDLQSAQAIPKCMVTDRKVQRSRGPVEDLWDKAIGGQSRFAWVLVLAVGLLSVEWLGRKLLRLA